MNFVRDRRREQEREETVTLSDSDTHPELEGEQSKGRTARALVHTDGRIQDMEGVERRIGHHVSLVPLHQIQA